MTAAWKAAGLTYNRYLAVAARAIRRSLKEDKRIVAERRAVSELRFATWKVCELGALARVGARLLMPQ
ncbi:mitochondrial ATP synthase epsilon chain domain-containing protein [Trichoderma ceciliae]